jgi:type III secretory pathway component EscS
VLTNILTVLFRDASTPENFEEIVNASGGYDDLASVVVKHISLALTSPEPTLVILLSYIFEFMVSTTKHEGLLRTLLSKGVITALIPALIALTGTATAVTNQCILRGMKVLVLSLTMDPMYRWVAEAVKAGLLQCTILCAVQFASMPQGESDVFVDLNLVVLRLLGKTLVSHAVVTAWRGASADAHKASQIPEFAPLPQYRHWKKIAKLAGERVGMLESWEASGCPWAAVCENTMVTCLNSFLTSADSIRSAGRSRKGGISSAVQIAKMLITAPPNVNTFIGAQLTEMSANPCSITDTLSTLSFSMLGGSLGASALSCAYWSTLTTRR